MIELPEVLTIARQMNDELRGKRIASVIHKHTPYKFAMYNEPQGGYEAALTGKTMGEVTGDGKWILSSLDQEHVLLLGELGGRILFHKSEKTLPKKHQLLLHFEDETFLTITIQMWGFIQVVARPELAEHQYAGNIGVSPFSDAFTFEHFEQILGKPEEGDKRSIKEFAISKPGIPGVGNGCLQDILFRARLHPRRKVVDTTEGERRAFYDAVRETLGQMVELGGRNTDRDLYNNPGGYEQILTSKAKGQPCPECGTPIEKIQYLGGACYLCPSCQTL